MQKNNSPLEKRDGESAAQHHKRIVYGKLVDKTLADFDYSEIAEAIYGQPYSSDVARRMLYGSRKTLETMDKDSLDSVQDRSVMSSIDAQIIELRKERQKFYDQRAAFNKVVRERSRQEELNEIITESIQNGALPHLDYEPHLSIQSGNDLLVSLND